MLYPITTSADIFTTQNRFASLNKINMKGGV